MICEFCKTMRGCPFAADVWKLNRKYDNVRIKTIGLVCSDYHERTDNRCVNILTPVYHLTDICVQQRDINSTLSHNIKLFTTALAAGLVSFFVARKVSRVNEVKDDDFITL
ncbi:MAG: hypothetical protein HQK97_04555 [Nitrospirae bacterium]|nr:hypothetical protein [Nitrospirota bacterium]